MRSSCYSNGCRLRSEAPIPGFSLAECDPIVGDEIARAVSWQGRRELKRLAGKPIRLRFGMKAADLYSIQFR